MELKIQKQYKKGKSLLVLGTGNRVKPYDFGRKMTVEGVKGIFLMESTDKRHPAEWDRLQVLARAMKPKG